MDESSVTSGCDNRAIFVALLKDFSVVLNKSMLPKVASAKEKAWGCLADQFSKNVGKQTSVGQLKKLLNNMKTAVKKKTDVNATGNKPITLLSWEADFLKICDSNENPVYYKIPGASCVGLGASSVYGDQKNSDIYDDLDYEPGTSAIPKNSYPPPSKKKKELDPVARQTELLTLACDLLSKNCREEETHECQGVAKVWGTKLMSLDPMQRKFAEKAINDILFEADMGTLHRNSVQINSIPSSDPLEIS